MASKKAYDEMVRKLQKLLPKKKAVVRKLKKKVAPVKARPIKKKVVKAKKNWLSTLKETLSTEDKKRQLKQAGVKFKSDVEKRKKSRGY